MWLKGAEHMMPAHRDDAYAELKTWLLAAFAADGDGRANPALTGREERGDPDDDPSEVQMPKPRGPSTRDSQHPLAGILGYSEG